MCPDTSPIRVIFAGILALLGGRTASCYIVWGFFHQHRACAHELIELTCMSESHRMLLHTIHAPMNGYEHLAPMRTIGSASAATCDTVWRMSLLSGQFCINSQDGYSANGLLHLLRPSSLAISWSRRHDAYSVMLIMF